LKSKTDGETFFLSLATEIVWTPGASAMIAGGLQQVTIVTVSSRKTDESATAENCGGHEEYVESCNSLQQQSDLHQVRVLLPYVFLYNSTPFWARLVSFIVRLLWK
jgi:hypothetical protein